MNQPPVRNDWPSLSVPFPFDRRLGCSQNVEKRLEDRIVEPARTDGADRQFAGRQVGLDGEPSCGGAYANATRNERYTQARSSTAKMTVFIISSSNRPLAGNLRDDKCNHFGIKRGSSPDSLL